MPRKSKTAADYEIDKPKVAKEPKVDPVLEKVMRRFNDSRNYIRRGFWETWKDARKLYNSQRIMVNYEGNSDTFIPETFTILQSIKSNVVGGRIAIDYFPTNKDQTGDVKVLKALMDQVWTQDNTKLKASWAIDDSLQVGNGYLWQYWNGQYPTNKYVPTEDNFFDPDCTSYENLRYGGYRYLTTLDALEKETIANTDYNPEDAMSERRVPRYKNLDRINDYKYSVDKKSGQYGEDKTAKQLREEMIAGSVLSTDNSANDDNLVEVICYHDKERIIKVANRCCVIEDVETPFMRKATKIDSVDDMGNPVKVDLPEIKPFIPVAPARDIVDGAMWYAKGEVEVIGDLQELLNDTQNQKTDNLNFALNRMWTLDPSQAHKIDQIQSVPGAVFTVPAGALQPVQQSNIGVDADNEIFRLQGMMRRATAADEIVQGASVKGSATATEINAQVIQAGARFSSKLENYESEFFKILANNMLKIMQIFLTQEQAVRLIGQEGVEWKNYNPGEYLGDYDIRVQLEATASRVRETEKQNAMQFFLLASKMPFVNQEALFKMTARTLFEKDENELEGLVQPMQQQLPPELMAMAQGGQAPAGPEGMPQQGMGEMASMPMSDVEAGATNQAMQAQGMNIPGMPQ
jgi:hypothetical protein